LTSPLDENPLAVAGDSSLAFECNAYTRQKQGGAQGLLRCRRRSVVLAALRGYVPNNGRDMLLNVVVLSKRSFLD
jgi:hypothetical protein